MRFGQSAFGASGAPAGVVDFRLARRNVIAEYRRGRLSMNDVCDAHPELRRAAQSYSRATGEDCPICEDGQLVHVKYVFGPQLPPSGRCVENRKELTKLTKGSGKGQFTCFVVEVCPSCSWNHLVEAVPVASRRSTDRSAETKSSAES